MRTGKSLAIAAWSGLLLAAGAASSVSAQTSAGEPSARPGAIPVEAFAKKATFTDLKLSPDGRAMAALVSGSVGAVAVLSVPEQKQIGGVRLDGDKQIVRYWWAGDK